MSEISGFFASENHDRTYTDDFVRGIVFDAIGNGIVPDGLNVIPVPGASVPEVEVTPGSAFINGARYENTENKILNLANVDASHNRIDRIVLRFDLSARQIILAVLTGTPSDSPAAPNVTKTQSVFEISLATVFIDKVTGIVSEKYITSTISENVLASAKFSDAFITAVNTLKPPYKKTPFLFDMPEQGTTVADSAAVTDNVTGIVTMWGKIVAEGGLESNVTHIIATTDNNIVGTVNNDSKQIPRKPVPCAVCFDGAFNGAVNCYFYFYALGMNEMGEINIKSSVAIPAGTTIYVSATYFVG